MDLVINLEPSCCELSLTEEQLAELVQKAKDWAVMHGICMRPSDGVSQDEVEIAPFMLLPTPFPKSEFEKGVLVQVVFNELIHKIAHDHEFLKQTLESCTEVDPFTGKLFEIYEKVYHEGFSQNMHLGLLRSDYMSHCREGCKIKQVEINTIASSFGALAAIMTKYHRFILTELGEFHKLENIPDNNSVTGLCQGLIEAWEVYNDTSAAILIVVEDVTLNIFDQRLIEFTIQELNQNIKVIRRNFNDLTVQAKLGPEKELIVGKYTISVVYYRSGYVPDFYHTERDWDVRLLIERSRAIKCPSIQYHLAGSKRIQQTLTEPGVLERFVDQKKAEMLRETFVNMYSLNFNDRGDEAVALALKNPTDFVLKPEREGGGNNIYDEDIKTFLEEKKDSSDRVAWTLMQRIRPPLQQNYVIRAGNSVSKQMFITELGIYGVILGDKNRIITNKQVGHILRTKLSTSNEGGIVAGYAALDGPFLL